MMAPVKTGNELVADLNVRACVSVAGSAESDQPASHKHHAQVESFEPVAELLESGRLSVQKYGKL